MDKRSWKEKKAKPHRCDCRGRTHGNPKVGDGMCRGSHYRAAVVERQDGNRMCRKWLQMLDWPVDDVEL